MKPFAQTSLIGDFFDALHANRPENDPDDVVAVTGGTRQQNAVVSVIFGDLNLEHLPHFAASLRELLTSTVRLIVLDFSHVQVFCPNAASVLVNFMSFVEGGGKRLILFQPNECVHSALSSLNLLHLFEILHSEEDLLLELPD